MYPKKVSVTAEVDGVALEGYGTYYIRDYAGATMTSPFNGIHCGDGWHRPYFNPEPITDEQIIKPSTQYLIDGYKECLKILKHKDEIKQIKFETKFEKVALQDRLDNMLKSKQLLKKKFKNGELAQAEYQQLVHNLNTEKFYLHQSIENCFKNIYEKKFGETIIKNLEEAVQILLSSAEEKDNAINA
jgi:hypothetical protein